MHQKVRKSVLVIHKTELSSVFYEKRRDIIKQFEVWKEAPDRKPILLRGARQIGKSDPSLKIGRELSRHEYCPCFALDV